MDSEPTHSLQLPQHLPEEQLLGEELGLVILEAESTRHVMNSGAKKSLD